MPRTAEEKKEARRLTTKKYRESHKENIKSSSKKYSEEHKEEKKEYGAKRYEEKREEMIKRVKEYRKTTIGKKNQRINEWKCRGIIDADLGAVYDYYVKQTHCMICKKEYKNTRDRHLDHEHSITDDDNIRYICCNRCNTYIVC